MALTDTISQVRIFASVEIQVYPGGSIGIYLKFLNVFMGKILSHALELQATWEDPQKKQGGVFPGHHRPPGHGTPPFWSRTPFCFRKAVQEASGLVLLESRLAAAAFGAHLHCGHGALGMRIPEDGPKLRHSPPWIQSVRGVRRKLSFSERYVPSLSASVWTLQSPAAPEAPLLLEDPPLNSMRPALPPTSTCRHRY